jgi:hypothetical protein
MRSQFSIGFCLAKTPAACNTDLFVLPEEAFPARGFLEEGFPPPETPGRTFCLPCL